MYLVDEFFCLFLMLLNEMRTVGESKNFGVNQKDEGGRWVQESSSERGGAFSARGVVVSD